MNKKKYGKETSVMREFDVSDIGFKLLDMIVKDKSRNEQNLL